jgi:hypothetical protein
MIQSDWIALRATEALDPDALWQLRCKLHLGKDNSLWKAYFRSIPRNMRTFDPSSGGFSTPCTVDMALESEEAELTVVEPLGVFSREDSADEAIAIYAG